MSSRLRSSALLAVGLALIVSHESPVSTAAPAVSRAATVPGSDLPIERVHAYTMAGKIRPLLFWISRDRVGMGRIVWRRGAGEAKAYELLIGTDPDSAPGRLNRWGYIAESREGANGALLALMSREEESSLEEVGDRTKGRAEFKVMRARVDAGIAASVVPRVSTPSEPTFRDVESLIEQVNTASDSASTRTIDVPPGTRPGFLGAVAELVHASVGALRDGREGGSAARLPSVPYVYGVLLYDLSMRSHERLKAPGEAARGTGQARGRFEIRNRATGDVTRFELIYGLDGPLAEVPTEIVYQPRWWLKVQLRITNN
jgi:hypothetical protein